MCRGVESRVDVRSVVMLDKFKARSIANMDVCWLRPLAENLKKLKCNPLFQYLYIICLHGRHRKKGVASVKTFAQNSEANIKTYFRLFKLFHKNMKNH